MVMPHISNRPVCELVPESAQYEVKAFRRMEYDGSDLVIEFQGEGFGFGRVIFRNTLGFRVMDELYLTEFWNTYSEPQGWLWEVNSGGWLDLERQRPTFNPDFHHEGVREFFFVDDHCVSVLCGAAPEVEAVVLPESQRLRRQGAA